MKTILVTEHPFLSNDYYQPIEYDQQSYPAITNAFMASKFANKSLRHEIAKMSQTNAVKRTLNYRVTTPDWYNRAYDIMYDLLVIKFNDPEMRRQLLDTGDDQIIYDNLIHDNDFGCCCCKKCNGKGKNLLGKYLMQIRDNLKQTGNDKEM